MTKETLDIPVGEPAISKSASDTGLFKVIENIQLGEVIIKGVAYAIIVSVFLSVVFIFVGGISFILSGGQEDKIKQAVSTIRYAIFGLIISVLAVVIVATVGKALGIDIVGYIDLGAVYDMVRKAGEGGAITGGAGGSGGTTLE